MILKFSSLTLQDAEILRTWNVKDLNNFYTGVDIRCDIVYNFISGVVIDIRPYDKYFCVIVQYNRNICFLYFNIIKPLIAVGMAIPTGTQIGTVRKFVRFECADRNSNYISLPVRIGSSTYYKTDPMPYLTGKIILSDPNSLFINDGN